MDDQLFRMIQDRFDAQDKRFDSQDKDLADIKELIEKHTEKDETYWKKLDNQEAQLSTLKKVGAGFVSAVGLVEWFFRK